ncbi:MAG: type II toxin-antitoxin system RelE/ParE family toxin [Phycisphaerae bacterium]
MKYAVIITPIAEAELRTAFEYIHKDSPVLAQRWLQTLYDKIASLEKFPERCAIAPDSAFVGEELRHMVVRSHRVIFRLEKSRRSVQVVGIRHGARLFIGEAPPREQDERDDAGQ